MPTVDFVIYKHLPGPNTGPQLDVLMLVHHLRYCWVDTVSTTLQNFVKQVDLPCFFGVHLYLHMEKQQAEEKKVYLSFSSKHKTFV